MTRGALSFAWLWLSLLAARPARASVPDCAVAVAPLIALSTQVDSEEAVSTASLEEHLAAALTARGFALCRGSVAGRPQVAELKIHASSAASGAIVAEIELSDAITRKRVERRMDLSAIPADGRSLAIASSADELLRASWAELTLIDAPAPVVAPPPAVARALAATVRAAPTIPRAELDAEASASAQRYLTAFGARVRLGYWALPRWGAFFGVRTAAGLRRSAPHGSVSLAETGVEMALAYGLLPIGSRFGVATEGGLSLSRLSFSASPTVNAEANSFTDWSLMANARLRAWLGSERARGTLSLGALYGVRPSRAYDGARIVTSNEGAGLEVVGGLALFF